jgi:hypothetical protein
MGLHLYDLAGAQVERRFSPYCWRAKLALAHKGLAFDTIPWHFTDKDAIAFSGAVCPCWSTAIVLFSIPGRSRPTSRTSIRIVHRCSVVMAVAQLLNAWADTVVNGGIARLIITDILSVLDEKDRSYS